MVSSSCIVENILKVRTPWTWPGRKPGWRWRIPWFRYPGNGHVFRGQFFTGVCFKMKPLNRWDFCLYWATTIFVVFWIVWLFGNKDDRPDGSDSVRDSEHWKSMKPGFYLSSAPVVAELPLKKKKKTIPDVIVVKLSGSIVEWCMILFWSTETPFQAVATWSYLPLSV